jgi:hypothetical protein
MPPAFLSLNFQGASKNENLACMTRRHGLFLWVLAALPAILLAETPEVHTQAVAWKLAESLCEPETVIKLNFPDQAEPVLTVSNVCGFTRNGKGYLSLVSLQGKLLNRSWLADLNAPARQQPDRIRYPMKFPQGDVR